MPDIHLSVADNDADALYALVVTLLDELHRQGYPPAAHLRPSAKHPVPIDDWSYDELGLKPATRALILRDSSIFTIADLAAIADWARLADMGLGRLDIADVQACLEHRRASRAK